MIRSFSQSAAMFCLDPNTEYRLTNDLASSNLSRNIFCEMLGVGAAPAFASPERLASTFLVYGIDDGSKNRRFAEYVDHVLVPDDWHNEIIERLKNSNFGEKFPVPMIIPYSWHLSQKETF